MLAHDVSNSRLTARAFSDDISTDTTRAVAPGLGPLLAAEAYPYACAIAQDHARLRRAGFRKAVANERESSGGLGGMDGIGWNGESGDSREYSYPLKGEFELIAPFGVPSHLANAIAS